MQNSYNHLTTKNPQNKATGFTLIELIVTMSIFSLLALMVVPSMTGVVQGNRLSVTNNDFVNALTFARSEAVKRRQTVTVCASNNGTACNSSWKEGWIVFTDKNSNATVDSSDTYLLVHDDANVSITISSLSTVFKYGPIGQTVSSCTDCANAQALDDNMIAFMPSPLEKIVMALLPISSAHASSGSSSSGSSSSGSSSSGSSSSGSSSSGSSSSGSSSSGSSSSGSSSSGSSSSGSSSLPICTTPVSGSSSSGSSSSGSSSSGSSSSGSSSSGSSSSSSSTVVSCNGGGLSGDIASNQVLICDSSRSGERGSLITISKVGRISRRPVICD